MKGATMNSYARITGVKQEYCRQDMWLPQKTSSFRSCCQGSAPGVVGALFSPRTCATKESLLSKPIKTSTSKPPGIPGKDEETIKQTTKV